MAKLGLKMVCLQLKLLCILLTIKTLNYVWDKTHQI